MIFQFPSKKTKLTLEVEDPLMLEIEKIARKEDCLTADAIRTLLRGAVDEYNKREQMKKEYPMVTVPGNVEPKPQGKRRGRPPGSGKKKREYAPPEPSERVMKMRSEPEDDPNDKQLCQNLECTNPDEIQVSKMIALNGMRYCSQKCADEDNPELKDGVEE